MESIYRNVAGDISVTRISASIGDKGGRYRLRYEKMRFDRFGNLPQREIVFQDGPVSESGNNGIQMEPLIAIIVHRINELNVGEFECDENHMAVKGLTDALKALERRESDRVKRGVEGRFES